MHGDHHAMWLSSDGRRIIEGNDGGVAFSRDGGATWQWEKNLPVSQPYHIGYSRELPYRVCLGLQDNGMWCAPSNPLNPAGVSASQWLRTGGGDGTWVLFDPRDPRYVWQAAGGQNFAGEVSIHDFKTSETREVGPYVRDQNVIDPKDLTYRFNWETPIAFDPFDATPVRTPRRTCLFATHRSRHDWATVSPDLTRNDPSHQIITGGITLDGTGAETTDTILDIEPSRAARGEIWIGTDDGIRAAHARRREALEERHAGRYSRRAVDLPRFRLTAPIPRPRTPSTTLTWSAIAHRTSLRRTTTARIGLRSRRTCRATMRLARFSRSAHLAICCISDSSVRFGRRGTTVRSGSVISSNLPAVSVRDIRLQPDGNDLADRDARSRCVGARRRGAASAVCTARARRNVSRPASRCHRMESLSRIGARAPTAKRRPTARSLTYYLSAPAKTTPTAEILDEHGSVVRRFSTHDEEGKPVPDLSNDAGFDRFAWDLTSEDVHPWTYAPAWNRRSFDSGAPVVPGRYTSGFTSTVERTTARLRYVKIHARTIRSLNFKRVARACKRCSPICLASMMPSTC